VRQVAEQHDGTASVANAVDGGAIFTLHLPGMSAEDVATHSESDQLASPGEPVGPVGPVESR
jgi:hypothetical protein